MNLSRRHSIKLTAAAFALGATEVGVTKTGGVQLSTEAKLDQLLAVHEIQNLMSKYEYFHVAGMDDAVIDLFAQNTPGTKLEINRGLYEGIEGVRKFVMSTAKGEGDRIGHLHLHTLTTPVIEIAGDGRTAQGVWISPGVETSPGADGKFNAGWSWLKYGVDFVKEDGAWKFWHFHIYRIFSAPYNESWAEQSTPTPRTAPEADRPATFYAGYTTTTKMENIPAPPTPYRSWDESRAYIK